MMKQTATEEASTVDTQPLYKIKLSGDGAKMTRLTGFVVISFSLLNDEDAVMSSKGFNTFPSVVRNNAFICLMFYMPI